jgi:hypothetical protein
MRHGLPKSCGSSSMSWFSGGTSAKLLIVPISGNNARLSGRSRNLRGKAVAYPLRSSASASPARSILASIRRTDKVVFPRPTSKKHFSRSMPSAAAIGMWSGTAAKVRSCIA